MISSLSQADAVLADVRARVAAAVAAREAAARAAGTMESAPAKPNVTPGREKVRSRRFWRGRGSTRVRTTLYLKQLVSLTL